VGRFFDEAADDREPEPTVVSPDGRTTMDATPPTGEGSDRLSLLVISERVITTVPLPASGEVQIGRARGCQVVIDDPSISRAHAALTIGPPLLLQDLGSANGTRAHERVVTPGEQVPIAPGDVIQLGNATLIVQQRPPPTRVHRIWSHEYFEARLEEECARGDRDGSTFAVARFHCEPPPSPAVLQEVLATAGRASDVIGEYSAQELEFLLVGALPPDAETILARIAGELRRAARVHAGVACFPRDGRNPHELIHRASPFPRAPEPLADAAVSAAIVADRRMQDLYRLAERIAAGHITVLVLGETGVGKEVLAERIHRMSARAGKPYLKLNCAALSETLLESELFGHERGAFTGAVATKPGLLETADGGTVFLDEVGELPHATQVKLLRVLEERVVTRVGGLKPRPIDVRFVAATNRDLESEIVRGTFRQDLFFRLNGATLVIPPLRERVTEIPELARAFAAQAARQMGIDPQPPLSSEALAALLRYSWPGNIRELRNVVERAVLLCGGDAILPAHLPLEKMRATLPVGSPGAPAPVPAAAEASAVPAAALRVGDATARIIVPAAGREPPESSDERERIVQALAACAGNQSAAAQMLGIARRTLINKLERYGISGPRKKREGGA
jgi:two-component system, NtrC family, response regulator AtoC